MEQINQIVTEENLMTYLGREEIEKTNETNETISQLSDNCLLFKKEWEIQQAIGLDKNSWFYWSSIFAFFKMTKEVNIFSSAAIEKHNSNSEKVINALFKKVVKTPPVRCLTFGCEQKQIKKCHGKLNRNSKGEITNSPAKFIMPEEENLYFTDKGKFIPVRLANDIMNDFHFMKLDKLYVYDNGVYVPDETLKKEIKKRLGDIFSRSTMNETINAIEVEAQKSRKELNGNMNIINLKNCLYDIDNNECITHTPEYLSLGQFNANYNKAANDCPVFLNFLSQTIPTDNIDLMQEIFGYCLTREVRAEKAFLFLGPAESGKSTILNTLDDLLGKENISHVSLQNLADRFKTVALLGKHANIVTDLPANAMKDSGIFKMIVSGEPITCEEKNQPAFTFVSYAKLLFSLNKLPVSSDKTEGFYRRLIIIPCQNIIPKNKKDRSLKEKIYEEKDAILQWALIGLMRLRENGFSFSESKVNEDIKNNYRIENNSILAFITDYCDFDLDGKVPRQKLYDEYKLFCHDINYKPFSQIAFNRELIDYYKGEVVADRTPRSEHPEGKRESVWKNIKLKTD